ncbi:hypothetical protein, partial [Vibrio sagamiensis]|uniref:hypothetical protein n=1 Tax=Vibrio sagamiensis TaxID=512650 RepID=UPI001D1210DE
YKIIIDDNKHNQSNIIFKIKNSINWILLFAVYFINKTVISLKFCFLDIKCYLSGCLCCGKLHYIAYRQHEKGYLGS